MLFVHLLRLSCDICFYSIAIMYQLVDFQMLNQSGIPDLSATLSWHTILFVCCWIQFASIFFFIVIKYTYHIILHFNHFLSLYNI